MPLLDSKWRKIGLGPPGFTTKVPSRSQVYKCQRVYAQAQSHQTRRDSLLTISFTALLGLLERRDLCQAAEQGIQASDYTVPALSSAGYRDKIIEVRGKAWKMMENFVDDNKYTDLSNSLVLAPIDDVRQSVLYIPSALLKEGKQQEAIGSRKAYTDYMRELKRLDELAQKATRFDADEEDVKDSLGRLSKRLDAVLQYVQ